MSGMNHKFALCRKSDAHPERYSVLLPPEPIDDSLEWLEINQEDEPVYDKETEITDVTAEKVDGKLKITYAKRLMTAEELAEVVE